MPSQFIPGTPAPAVLYMNQALFGTAPANAFYTTDLTFATANGVNAYAVAKAGVLASTSDAALSKLVLGNLGLNANTLVSATAAADYAALEAAVASIFAANPTMRGQVILNLTNILANAESNAIYGAAALAFNTAASSSLNYSNTLTNVTPQTVTIGAPAATSVTRALTTGVDNLTGTAGNDTFNAFFLGGNTLASGDTINGGAGIDTLFADLLNPAVAQTVITNGVEIVKIRAQNIATDSADNNPGANDASQIDAERMSGVTQWESNNSRADLVIEDVRILPGQITKDITIAMVETDPGHVDMAVYFDQLSLRSVSSNTSSLNLRVLDTYAVSLGLDPLKDSPYGSFKFTSTNAAGVSTVITLASQAIQDAQTFPALAAALQAELDKQFGAGTATATVGSAYSVTDSVSGKVVGGNEIVISAKAALTFTTPAGSGWLATDTVPAVSGLYTNFNTGATTSTELVTAKVILDDVGRGSTGGDLVIGGLSVGGATGGTSSSLGVQRFEIEVRDNSKMEAIASTNNTLREVTIVNGLTTSNSNAYQTTVKDAGNLTVNGNSGVNGANITNGLATDAQAGINANMPGAANQLSRGFGFSDVRLIDGSAMTGKLAFSAEVTQASIAKYANLVDVQALPAGDNIAFTYNGGTNADALFVRLDSTATGSRNTITSGREDFTFTVNGNAGNDVINVGVTNGTAGLNGGNQAWYTNQKLNANVTVNGGEGNDTIRTPGAGDKIINGDGGDDTLYVDNSGSQNATTTAAANAALAAAAYTAAAAAELAAAQGARVLSNTIGPIISDGRFDGTAAGSAITPAAQVAALAVLDQVTPTNPPALPVIAHATLANASAAAVAAGALTFAQKIALDAAYNSATGGVITPAAGISAPATLGAAVVPVPGNVTAAELAAGDALLATYVAAANAAVAADDAAAANVGVQNGFLNATQLAVVNATAAINNVEDLTTPGIELGTATGLAAVNALASALVNGTTQAAAVAAIDAASAKGLFGGVAFMGGTTAANVLAAVGAGSMDAVDAAAVVALLSPLQNQAVINNNVAQATLTAALAADAAAVNTAAAVAAADPANGVGDAIVNNFVGAAEAAAAATAARNASDAAAADVAASQAINTALNDLKAAINVGTLDAGITIAFQNANASIAAAIASSAADGTGAVIVNPLAANQANLLNLAGFGGGAAAVIAAEELAFDIGANGVFNASAVNSLIVANTVQTDLLTAVAADRAATVTATALASANAAIAAASSTGPLSTIAAMGTYVLNTSNQLASYNRATMDDRNISDLKSDVDNTYNLAGASVNVAFKGIEAKVVIDNTGYKTSDLQVNQAIKKAINLDPVLSKLLLATDGPGNTLVITSLIDGAQSIANLVITVTAPTTLSTTDVAGAAAVYGVAATDVAVLAAMAAAKTAFDTKGDYVDQLAETGAANGNALITGAASRSTSDNTITGGAGNDVIVLGTTSGLDALNSSNDTVVFAAGFGNDTIVNFRAGADTTGGDVLNFSALGGSTLGTAFNVNKSINVATEVAATNGTAALVAALFTDSATAQTHVYAAVDTTTNIAKIYSVTDAAGTGAGSVVATLVGTVDLADTTWSTLTAANFA